MAIQALQQQITTLAQQAKAVDPETMSNSEKDSILVTIDNFRQQVDIESKNNEQTRGSAHSVHVLIPNSSSDDRISQLPIEVITIIFGVVIGKTDDLSRRGKQEILNTETVCKQWQAILKNIRIFNYLKNDQILDGLSNSLNKLALSFQSGTIYIKALLGAGKVLSARLEIGFSSSIGGLKKKAATALGVRVEDIKYCTMLIKPGPKSISDIPSQLTLSDDVKLTNPEIQESILTTSIVNLIIKQS